MISTWKRHRRRLRALERQYRQRDLAERRHRHQLFEQAEHTFLRTETLFWAAVTGSILVSRRKSLKEDERGNLLTELLASLWVMQRWRRLAARGARMARNARSDTAADARTSQPQRFPRR